MDEPTRSFLEKALALDGEVVALTIEDRERILWALDDVRTEALAGCAEYSCKSMSGAGGTASFSRFLQGHTMSTPTAPLPP